MANTFKFGNGNWAVKKDSVLAYNDENNNYKPLPFDFTRDTIGTYVDSDGLIKTAARGEARIDYLDNANGHLLLEPSRTNSFLNSNLFTTWSKEATVTLTANYGVSPDGTQNSTRMQMSSNDSIYVGTQSGLTASVYVKGVQGETIRLSNGSVILHTLTGQWDRIECYDSGSVSNVISINTYSGATARDIELFGAQLEAGSYATSYIPTNGQSVTRAGETCSQTVPDGVIGQTEGAIYVEIDYTLPSFSSEFSPLYIGEGTYEKAIYFNILNSVLYATAYENGTREAVINMGTLSQGINKMAISYEIGSFVAFLNGVNKGSDTPSALPSPSKVYLGQTGTSTALQKTNVLDVKLYDTALTNAELATLTT